MTNHRPTHINRREWVERFDRMQDRCLIARRRPADIDGLQRRAGFAFDKYDARNVHPGGQSLSRARNRPPRLIYVCRVGKGGAP